MSEKPLEEVKSENSLAYIERMDRADPELERKRQREAMIKPGEPMERMGRLKRFFRRLLRSGEPPRDKLDVESVEPGAKGTGVVESIRSAKTEKQQGGAVEAWTSGRGMDGNWNDNHRAIDRVIKGDQSPGAVVMARDAVDALGQKNLPHEVVNYLANLGGGNTRARFLESQKKKGEGVVGAGAGQNREEGAGSADEQRQAEGRQVEVDTGARAEHIRLNDKLNARVTRAMSAVNEMAAFVQAKYKTVDVDGNPRDTLMTGGRVRGVLAQIQQGNLDVLARDPRISMDLNGAVEAVRLLRNRGNEVDPQILSDADRVLSVLREVRGELNRVRVNLPVESVDQSGVEQVAAEAGVEEEELNRGLYAETKKRVADVARQAKVLADDVQVDAVLGPDDNIQEESFEGREFQDLFAQLQRAESLNDLVATNPNWVSKLRRGVEVVKMASADESKREKWAELYDLYVGLQDILDDLSLVAETEGVSLEVESVQEAVDSVDASGAEDEIFVEAKQEKNQWDPKNVSEARAVLKDEFEAEYAGIDQMINQGYYVQAKDALQELFGGYVDSPSEQGESLIVTTKAFELLEKYLQEEITKETAEVEAQ